MGTSRTSNKDILDAITAQTQAIATLADAISNTTVAKATPQVVEAETPAPQPEAERKVKVDGAYKAHMEQKALDHATTKGEDVVLYARRNKSGETKLAYALKSRYLGVIKAQPSCLGALAEYNAS